MSSRNNTPMEALLQDVNYLAAHLKAAADSAHSVGGVSSAGYQVLKTLAEYGDQTIPRIVKLCGTSRQNIRVLVSRLAQGGWLEFAGNPEHQRSDLVRLTEAGLTLSSRAAEGRKEAVAKSLSIVPEADLKAASAALSRVVGSVSSGRKRTIIPRLTERRALRMHPQVVRPSLAESPKPGIADEPEENQLPVNLL